MWRGISISMNLALFVMKDEFADFLVLRLPHFRGGGDQTYITEFSQIFVNGGLSRSFQEI